MSLRHAPCGGAANPDPDYPYADGNIGGWGFDIEQSTLVDPGQGDLMSYCRPRWISDYQFTSATDHRLREEATTPMPDVAAARVPTLLVWGGADANGVPSLRPAFLVDATPALPPPCTAYALSAHTTDGAPAFSYAFDMPEVADSDGGGGFVFAIPADGDWAADLRSITLAGPGGTTVLDHDTDDPMVILRDPRSGQVRAFLRGAAATAMTTDVTTARTVTAADVGGLLPQPGLEALFSRGLPGRYRIDDTPR